MAVAPAPARPRPGGGRLFIIIGLFLAILAGLGVFLFGGALSGGGGGGATTTVVVAKQAIPDRHTITEADLDTIKVGGTLINSYATKSDVINLISQIQIAKGVVITSDMLGKDVSLIGAGSAPAYLPLPKGWVAMTIPTGEQQGVAGNITVGEYITVIASANITVFNTGGTQAPGPPKVVTKTVFYNVRVIRVGPASANVQPANGATTVGGTTGATGGVSSSLTVELTQCDSEFMIWFLNNTTVRYTLESPEDFLAQAPSGPDATCPTLQTAQGVSQREVEARYHFTAL